MFEHNTKKSDVLEKFRIKAHLRSYIKDPVIIDEKLLLAAVYKLKKLPYEDNDPTDTIAIKLVVDAYCLGYFRDEDLTEAGCHLIRYGKYHDHHQQRKDRAHHDNLLIERCLKIT
ncbi:MAG TPA: hypothetical protein ENJ87_10075 [Gammaproteobacteria bacterium]|nr:hypothetical protein [Gammaproteobacteria bacterium]